MFRLVNVDGRAALEHDGGWHDLATVTGEAAWSDPIVAVSRHAELHDLAAQLGGRSAEGSLSGVTLGAPIPVPAQTPIGAFLRIACIRMAGTATFCLWTAAPRPAPRAICACKARKSFAMPLKNLLKPHMPPCKRPV